MALKKEIIRNNLLVQASSIISVIIGFVSSIVLARLLGPFNFGLYSFVLTVVGFFSIFTTWGISSAIIRHLSNYLGRNKNKEANTVIGLGFKLRLFGALIVGTVLIIFSESIAINIFNKPNLGLIILLSGIILTLDSLSDFFFSVLTGFKKFRELAIFKVLDRSLKLIFALILIIIGFSYIGAIGGILAASIVIFTLSALLVIRNKALLSPIKASINNKAFYTFCLWSFIGGIGAILFNSVDSFMTSVFLGIEDVGFYRISFTWTFALVTIFPISWIVLSPYFSSSKKNEVDSVFHNSFRYSLILAIPLAFTLSAYAGPLISIFYGEEFQASVAPLFILSLTTIPLILSSLFTTNLTGIKEPAAATKITGISVIFNIVLNYIFIFSFGIIGVAVATLISRVLESGLFFIFIKRKISLKSSLIIKPIIAASISYYTTTYFFVTNIFDLIGYGITSLLIYFGIMWLIRGITSKDIEVLRGIYAR